MAQEQKTRKRRDVPAPTATETASKAADTSDVDSLLEDIDELLSEMGQDFAAEYVQKGGE